jgi:hypothetical protein
MDIFYAIPLFAREFVQCKLGKQAAFDVIANISLPARS